MGKVQCLMVGTCPRCGQEFIRSAEVDFAACACENPPLEVPLSPGVILPIGVFKKFQRLADKENMTLEEFVNAVLEWWLQNAEKR